MSSEKEREGVGYNKGSDFRVNLTRQVEKDRKERGLHPKPAFFKNNPRRYYVVDNPEDPNCTEYHEVDHAEYKEIARVGAHQVPIKFVNEAVNCKYDGISKKVARAVGKFFSQINSNVLDATKATNEQDSRNEKALASFLKQEMGLTVEAFEKIEEMKVARGKLALLKDDEKTMNIVYRGLNESERAEVDAVLKNIDPFLQFIEDREYAYIASSMGLDDLGSPAVRATVRNVIQNMDKDKLYTVAEMKENFVDNGAYTIVDGESSSDLVECVGKSGTVFEHFTEEPKFIDGARTKVTAQKVESASTSTTKTSTSSSNHKSLAKSRILQDFEKMRRDNLKEKEEDERRKGIRKPEFTSHSVTHSSPTTRKVKSASLYKPTLLQDLEKMRRENLKEEEEDERRKGIRKPEFTSHSVTHSSTTSKYSPLSVLPRRSPSPPSPPCYYRIPSPPRYYRPPSPPSPPRYYRPPSPPRFSYRSYSPPSPPRSTRWVYRGKLTGREDPAFEVNGNFYYIHPDSGNRIRIKNTSYLEEI